MANALDEREHRFGVFDAWVVYLDVYGFSAMVKGGMSAELQERLIRTHKKARKLVKRNSPDATYIFISDSTCLVYPAPENSNRLANLDRCAEDVSEIMTLFLEEGLPLRGSAAFGEVAYGDRILVGRPVLRAVSLEKSIPFPLVVVPLSELYPSGKSPTELDNWGRFTLQKIAVRPTGQLHALIIFPSNLDSFAEKVRRLLDRYLTFGPPEVAVAWALASEHLQAHFHSLDDRR